MSQMSLFGPEVAKPMQERPVDPHFVRKHLQRLVGTIKAAERMPWSDRETESIEQLVSQLADFLPAEEGESLRAVFLAELTRIRGTR